MGSAQRNERFVEGERVQIPALRVSPGESLARPVVRQCPGETNLVAVVDRGAPGKVTRRRVPSRTLARSSPAMVRKREVSWLSSRLSWVSWIGHRYRARVRSRGLRPSSGESGGRR
jgi:hypothetical protein